jgi:anthranilate 1,2-dioxygenase small subunit
MNVPVAEFTELERVVGRLNQLYGMSIDEDRLEDWPTLFVEDGRYIIDPRENRDLGLDGGYWMYYTSQGMMRDRVTALRHVNVFNKHYYRHIISDAFVERVEDGVIAARSNYLLVETNWEGKSQLLSAGVYHDRVNIENGAARFLEKVVVPDSFHTSTAIISPI